jgi:flagellum-specific peptidoglycan hydrolase FlgJ
MKKLLVTFTLMLCLVVYAKTPPKQREVYQQIVSMGIKFPDIALAQAILESGNFKSKIAVQNNNLFGMRLPKSRETTAVGQKSGYARYLSWKDSVKDFKMWQDSLFKRRPNMTRSQYISYLNRIYSETPNYISRIRLIVEINKNKYEEDSTYASNGRANDSVRINL